MTSAMNDYFEKFRAARLKVGVCFLADASGVPLKMPVKGDAEIWLHIAADFKTLDPALAIGYAIYPESGELLYRSSLGTSIRAMKSP
jgi:hypothetical protein